MFSLQRTLGRDADFCRLLEDISKGAVESVDCLRELLVKCTPAPTLEDFANARRKDKEILGEINLLLTRALVTSFERDDIEALSEALYKIPKTIEKFAERYIVHYVQIQDFDFSRQLILVEQAASTVHEMVHAFGAFAGVKEIKRINSRIQRLENEADDVILQLLQKLYQPGFPPLKAFILKDLIELNEKVVDRCRDAGGIITRICIKNA